MKSEALFSYDDMFSHKIYLARKLKRISLKEVAKAVGISEMYLSELERKKIIPDDDLVVKLADCFGYKKEELQQTVKDEFMVDMIIYGKNIDFNFFSNAVKRNSGIRDMVNQWISDGVQIMIANKPGYKDEKEVK